MDKINKLVSSIVLACFMLNTAVSDLALADSVKNATDTIGAGSRFNDINGPASPDELKIAVEVQTLLRKIPGAKGEIKLEELAKQPGDSTLGFSTPDLRLFPERAKALASGLAAFECSVKGQSGKAAIYYAVFSLKKRSNGWFPLEIYTKEQFDANTRAGNFDSARAADKTRRPKEDRKAIHDHVIEKIGRSVGTLSFSRKDGDAVMIGHEIRVTVNAVGPKGKSADLIVQGPSSMQVLEAPHTFDDGIKGFRMFRMAGQKIKIIVPGYEAVVTINEDKNNHSRVLVSTTAPENVKISRAEVDADRNISQIRKDARTIQWQIVREMFSSPGMQGRNVFIAEDYLEAAERLSLDNDAALDALNWLEENGYLEADSRVEGEAVQYSLTDKGIEAFKQGRSKTTGSNAGESIAEDLIMPQVSKVTAYQRQRDMDLAVRPENFIRAGVDADDRGESKAVIDDITATIGLVSERLATVEMDKATGVSVKREAAVTTNDISIITRKTRNGMGLCVTVTPGSSTRNIGIYREMVEGMVWLRRLMFPDQNPARTAQQEVIDNIIEDMVRHEIGHHFENRAGYDFVTLTTDPDVMQDYYMFLAGTDKGMPETAEESIMFAEALADITIAGPGAKEYISKKGAYLFYRIARAAPDTYRNGIDESEVRRMAQRALDSNKYSRLTLQFVAQRQNKSISQVMAETVNNVVRNYDLFFGGDGAESVKGPRPANETVIPRATERPGRFSGDKFGNTSRLFGEGYFDSVAAERPASPAPVETNTAPAAPVLTFDETLKLLDKEVPEGTAALDRVTSQVDETIGRINAPAKAETETPTLPRRRPTLWHNPGAGQEENGTKPDSSTTGTDANEEILLVQPVARQIVRSKNPLSLWQSLEGLRLAGARVASVKGAVAMKVYNTLAGITNKKAIGVVTGDIKPDTRIMPGDVLSVTGRGVTRFFLCIGDKDFIILEPAKLNDTAFVDNGILPYNTAGELANYFQNSELFVLALGAVDLVKLKMYEVEAREALNVTTGAAAGADAHELSGLTDANTVGDQATLSIVIRDQLVIALGVIKERIRIYHTTTSGRFLIEVEGLSDDPKTEMYHITVGPDGKIKFDEPKQPGASGGLSITTGTDAHEAVVRLLDSLSDREVLQIFVDSDREALTVLEFVQECTARGIAVASVDEAEANLNGLVRFNKLAELNGYYILGVRGSEELRSAVVRTPDREPVQLNLEEILGMVPKELDGYLNIKKFIQAVNRSGSFPQIVRRGDDKTAVILSNIVTFGEEIGAGKFEEGLGAILPDMVRSGVKKIAVIVKRGTEGERQRAFIDEINKKLQSESIYYEPIVYAETVADAADELKGVSKYYYLKTEKENDLVPDSVQPINVIVKKILDAIGSVLDNMPADLIEQMHEAARRFSEAA